MRTWHISDTHNFHSQLAVPNQIDLIIHSGDAGNWPDAARSANELLNFIEWYGHIKAPHKIYVAGNHDTALEKGLVTYHHFEKAGIHYLQNTHVTIEGLTIFGSPYTPTFGNWSFMIGRNKIDRHWQFMQERIEALGKLDILITHGPPKGILDLTKNVDGEYELVGDKGLYNLVHHLQPRLHCFGHIHDYLDCYNQGVLRRADIPTIFSNGACVTDRKFELGLTSQGNIIEI